MATSNPRAIQRYEGIGRRFVTFAIDDSTITYSATEVGGSAQVNMAVSLSDDETIKLAGDGEGVVGKLILVEPDGSATVQDQGYTTLPKGSGDTATRGTRIVGAGDGYIRSAASAEAAELLVAQHQLISVADDDALIVKLN